MPPKRKQPAHISSDDSSDASSSIASSDEDDLFSYADAGNLDDISNIPRFNPTPVKDADLTSLQVEIFKNKNLKKRKRESAGASESREEDESASARKRKKVNTDEHYRKMIEEKQREQDELRRKHREVLNRRLGGVSGAGDTDESSALEEKMREADKALEELMKSADSTAAYTTTSSTLFSPMSSKAVEIIKDLDEARRLLRTSELQEHFETQKLSQIDQEIERQFMHEKLRREEEERRQRAEEMMKLQALRAKQQKDAGAGVAADEPDVSAGNTIKLTVRVSRNESVEVSIGDKLTALQLLHAACRQLRCDPSQCSLEFDGQKLKGHEVLSTDLDVEDDDLFDMRVPDSARNYYPPTASATVVSIPPAGKKLTLTFQYGRGASLDLDVYDEWTPVQITQRLKQKIPNVVGDKKVSLYFDGEKIRDASTLESMDIEDEDTVEMRLK